MNKVLSFIFSSLLLFVAASCGDDDKYQYPSVKLDYLTVQTDRCGALSTAETDDGRYYKVSQDLTGKLSTADSTLRIVANYEQVIPSAEDSRTADMKVYSWISAISPLPQPVGKFEQGVRTDPVSVVSIWPGKGYLNLLITVREQTGTHRLHFVEDELSVVDGTSQLKLRLYHSIDTDSPLDYDKRIYLSIPLLHYFTEGVNQLDVTLMVNTYAEGVKPFNFEFHP